MLPIAAAAGPTAGHVFAAPSSLETSVNREMFERRSFPGSEMRAEAIPSADLRPLSSTIAPTRTAVTVPRFLPVVWYGQNSLVGPFANCTNAMYYPALISAASPTQALSSGCFGGSFLNSASDSPAHLVPGHNKDALYGPAYNPDANSLQ